MIFAIIVAPPPTILSAEYHPKFLSDTLQVCIERFEDQGSANIREVDIALSETLAFSMLGGSAACGYLTAGRHEIVMSWVDANSTQRKTSTVVFSGSRGAIIEFEICQPTSATDNRGPWIIKQPGDKSGPQCE
jgi:hypothetical protein